MYENVSQKLKSGYFLLILLCCIAQPFEAKAASQPIIKGTRYLNLKQVAARLGMEFITLQPKKKVALTSKWTRMEFTVHKRDVIIDGIKVHFGFPIAYQHNEMYMSKRDYEQVIAPILTPQIFKNTPGLRHIVLDPGHGGRDVGAIHPSKRLYEKNLTLDLAKRLKTILQKQGYRVTLTRKNDTYISLERRAAIANQVKADLFISLHFNASEFRQVSGIETFAFTPRYQPSTGRSKLTNADRRMAKGNKNDPWNMLPGFYIQRELIRTLKWTDRGCKRARFSVLRDLNCPGILVEAGFLSHAEEGKKIEQPYYRQAIAQSISQGIKRYQTTLNRLSHN